MKNQRSAYWLSRATFWFSFTLMIGAFLIFSKLYLLDLYRVNGSSMEGTFKNGDILLINKTSPPSGLHRGEIIVYQLFKSFFVVKRCIGLPGDFVQLRNDSIFVNNLFLAFPKQALSMYQIRFNHRESIRAFLENVPGDRILSVIPDSGMITATLTTIEADKFVLEKDIEMKRMLHIQIDGKIAYFQPAKWTVNNLGPIQVPAQHYFMMGDNGIISEDSRYLGYIHEDQIIGKVITLN